MILSKVPVSKLQLYSLLSCKLNDELNHPIFVLFQLADIRGNNKKYTLLKFFILQLQQSNPEALNFPDELKSVPKAAACK